MVRVIITLTPNLLPAQRLPADEQFVWSLVYGLNDLGSAAKHAAQDVWYGAQAITNIHSVGLGWGRSVEGGVGHSMSSAQQYGGTVGVYGSISARQLSAGVTTASGSSLNNSFLPGSGGSVGYPDANTQPTPSGNTAWGGSYSAGRNLWVSDATSASQQLGNFDVQSLTIPLYAVEIPASLNFQLASSGPTWVASVGLAQGAGYSQYTTNTQTSVDVSSNGVNVNGQSQPWYSFGLFQPGL